MPFAAKNMFYDERWIEKQERGFTWWINYVLTPDDFKVNTEVAKGKQAAGFHYSNMRWEEDQLLNLDSSCVSDVVNAVTLAMGSDNKFSVPKAPTKDEMSFSTYTARRKLNRLRRSACQLFTSEIMVKAIQRLELEVEARRLLVRKDRHLWKDIGKESRVMKAQWFEIPVAKLCLFHLSGERRKVLNWLLSYNPLWLRIGLEVFSHTSVFICCFSICLFTQYLNFFSFHHDYCLSSDDLWGADLTGEQQRHLGAGYVHPAAAAVEPRHRCRVQTSPSASPLQRW